MGGSQYQKFIKSNVFIIIETFLQGITVLHKLQKDYWFQQNSIIIFEIDFF